MNEWIVTIDMATPHDLDNDTLIAMDEHAEDYDGSCGARGLDGRGATFHFTIDGATHEDAVGRGSDLARKVSYEAEVNDFAIVAVGVETPEVAERRALRPDTPELLAATDVAELLGVSRQRVHQLSERPDFPAPYVRLGSGPVWTRPTIEAFDEAWSRKPGRPARTAN